MNQRERQNQMDETQVMPVVPQNERVSYQDMAMHLVIVTIEDSLDAKSQSLPEDFDVYLVWFCKTLQNWKALVATTLPDGLYFEVTHNGDLRETYVDTYHKVDHRKYLDSEV